MRLRLSSQTIKSASQGSTLIELLIAATIVTMVLTAVAIAMMYSIQREAQNRYQESAVMLAQTAVDILQMKRADLGWERFTSSFMGDNCLEGDDVLQGTNCSSETVGGLAFTTDVDVDPYDDPITGSNDLDARQVEVTVRWTSSQDESTYVLKQIMYKGAY